MFDRAYQAVRERTPGLGYEFQHANKIYLEKTLKLNECLKLALTDQVSYNLVGLVTINKQILNGKLQVGSINFWNTKKTLKLFFVFTMLF